MADDPRGLIPYIRDMAQFFGISPDIAVKVGRSEGLSNPIGDNGKSFGAFQLYTGGGLGNDFQRETGLDPSDPKNERATIDYALKWASQHGWGAFHGAKRVGIAPFEGITIANPPVGAPLSAPQMAQSSPSVLAPMGLPQTQNATQQPLQGGSGGAAPGMAAPLGAPVPPPAQQFMPAQQLRQAPAFRPQINLMPLQQMMAAYPQLRGLLPLFSG